MSQVVAGEAGFRPDLSVMGNPGQPDFVASLRMQGGERFSEVGLPTRRDEEWRFTPLSTIGKTPFMPSQPGVADPPSGLWTVDGADVLVFVDGHLYAAAMPADLPEGVTVTDLASAFNSHPELIARHLGRHAANDERPFVALNSALLQNGAFVHVARGKTAARPIHLVFVATSAGGPTASYPRNLVIVEEGGQATVVESHQGDAGAHFTCPVTEVVLGAGARFDHVKVQEEIPGGSHIAGLHVAQQASSSFSSRSISFGGALVRNDLTVVLSGEQAECTLDGLYLPRGRQLVDNHLLINHASPDCASHQLFKGVLEERSRAVFNGRVVVAEGAHGTDARQSNRNLLLSAHAKANSNPQLEIFADDVRCTHGSAVGKLDEEAIFYLRSRGIGRAEAKNLLTHAFASEVIGRVQHPELREHLDGLLRERLPLGISE